MQNEKSFSQAPPAHMTGAELQTLREACSLSREELGDLCNVAARTVKHWEGGRAGVPADVADLARRLDAMASLAANEAMQAIRGAIEQAGRMPDDVVMVRYRDAQDLARYRPDMAGMPPALHGSIVNRLRLALPWFAGFERLSVRVVWMQPDVYESWRSAYQLPDNEATRSQWAAQQVDAQAAPHRGDQPPA